MRVTISTGEATTEVRAVRLTDGRVAAAVPPALAVLAGQASVTVDLVVDPDGSREETREWTRATATIVRSGRAWTEARGRLREERGWARRFAKAPSEVILLRPVDDDQDEARGG